MEDIKFKKDYKKYNYYTEDKKYFIKKESGNFTLYDYYDEKIKDFKTLKEVRKCILLLNSNPFKFLHESFDFLDYIDRCEKNITHYKFKYRHESVKYYTDVLKLANEFKKIAENEGLVISKSPYSCSFYAHKECENITWEFKPENSYRFSDHWNWSDSIKCITHCKTIDNKDYGLCICQYIDGYYRKI